MHNYTMFLDTHMANVLNRLVLTMDVTFHFIFIYVVSFYIVSSLQIWLKIRDSYHQGLLRSPSNGIKWKRLYTPCFQLVKNLIWILEFLSKQMLSLPIPQHMVSSLAHVTMSCFGLCWSLFFLLLVLKCLVMMVHSKSLFWLLSLLRYINDWNLEPVSLL